MISLCNLPKRFFLRLKELSDESIASATKKVYGFAVNIYIDL